jgi:Family of unknown function (DUF6114)
LSAADSTRTPARTGIGLRRARLAFRAWRRTRPFWGGLLVFLGGLEILSTTVVSLGPTLRVGLGGVDGFLGTLIAAVLALCGLLLWFTPAQRVFYSIVAVLLALATFNTINYGGFFIGMLLGIIGGALAFAWTQAPGRAGRAGRAERRPDDRPRTGGGGLGFVLGKLRPGGAATAGHADSGSDADSGPSTDPGSDAGPQPDAGAGSDPGTGLEPGSTRNGAGAHGGGSRTLSMVAIPLALSMLAAPALPGAQAANPAHQGHPVPARLTGYTGGHGSGCILVILCPSPSPTPSPGSPSPRPTGSSSPAPGSSSSPRPGGQQSGQGKSSGKNRKHRKNRKKIKHTKAPRGLVAAAVPSVLNARSAKLVGLAYDGVAEVPRASGGPVQMMKFSLRSVTLTGSPTLTIHQNDSIATTSTTLLSFTGNVVLYATKLSGDLLGVPLTITPSSPLSLVLKLLSPLTQGLTVTMTHVVTNQPVTTSAASTWSNFLISVKPA